jgi:hypothetical protein
MFRGYDAINATAKVHGGQVADVLQAFIVTASQPMTMPQLPHECSGVWSNSPVSPDAGPRSIPRSCEWRCRTMPRCAREILPAQGRCCNDS